jgi:hypothetical protein
VGSAAAATAFVCAFATRPTSVRKDTRRCSALGCSSRNSNPGQIINSLLLDPELLAMVSRVVKKQADLAFLLDKQAVRCVGKKLMLRLVCSQAGCWLQGAP